MLEGDDERIDQVDSDEVEPKPIYSSEHTERENSNSVHEIDTDVMTTDVNADKEACEEFSMEPFN